MMELRRAAEAALRSIPMTPFLQSCSLHHASRRSNPIQLARGSQRAVLFRVNRHAFSTSARELQPATAPKNDEGVEEDAREQDAPREPERRIHIAERHTIAPPVPKPRSPSASPSKPRAPGNRDRNFDFLKTAKRAPDFPTLREQSRPQAQPLREAERERPQGQDQPSSTATAQGAQPPPANPESRPNPKPFDPKDLVPGADTLDFLRSRPSGPSSRSNSVQELLASFGGGGGGGSPSSPSTSPSTPYRPGDRQRTDLSNMLRPPTYSHDHMNAKTLADYRRHLEEAMRGPDFRIGPTLGRSVAVSAAGNMDVARAFQTVNAKCAANSVRKDFNYQRFHERPGIKRKRLVSLRWRARFKEAFTATIKRVQDMKRKGW